MVTTEVEKRVKKMSEAVEKGLITSFEEKVINRAVDILRSKVKCLFNNDVFTEMTEDDLDLAEDVIRGFFNNTVYVTALRGKCIEIEPNQTNYLATEEGLVITSVVFRIFLTKRRAGESEIDLTDMIEGTKWRNHFIINPNYNYRDLHCAP